MIFVTFDLEHTYAKKWCYVGGVYMSVNIKKLAMFFNVILSFSKTKDKLVMT